MKFLLTISFLLFGFWAGAGTSVGNFTFITQPEFEFRIGYPQSWQAVRTQSAQVDIIEHWELSNAPKVKNPDQVSSLTFDFIKNFPAKNESELHREIQKRHPGLSWNKINNPDFTIGFVSNQVFVGTNKTQSFEYYFMPTDKVVRIEAVRHSFEQGATDVDTILSTVRRVAETPRVLSVTSLDPKKKTLNVGDNYCYKIEMDLMRNDFSKDGLKELKIQGAPQHWFFKSVTWSAKESAFLVCLIVNQRFGPKGLSISEMSFQSDNGGWTQCQENKSGVLSCSRDSGSEVVKCDLPDINNANPDVTPPIFKSVTVGTDTKSIRVSAQDQTGLQIAKVSLETKSNSTDNDSVVAFVDQMQGPDFVVSFAKERLQYGFTRVISLELTDKVGNIAVLKAESGDRNYKYFEIDKKPVETNIPVVSLMRGEM